MKYLGATPYLKRRTRFLFSKDFHERFDGMPSSDYISCNEFLIFHCAE